MKIKLPLEAKIKTHTATSGAKSVATATFGNLLVTVLKLLSWVLTASPVMLSEGIHSLADTTNESLLLLGIKRSQRPADDDYAYGYRQERFFWALISACGIFFLGAGVTFYHGVESLLNPEPVHYGVWTFVILAISFLLEGYSLLTAVKETKERAGDETFRNYLKHSGDPTILAVIYEDSAALIGIVIAIVCITITSLTGNYVWDASGSILISFILAFVAIVLMRENRRFILNKSIPRKFREKIHEALLSEDLVDEIHDFKTVMVGVDEFIVKAEIEINGHFLAEQIIADQDMTEEYKKIKSYQDFLRYTSELCDQTTRIMGREIDSLEKRIIEKVPHIKHIDIETN